MPETTASEAKQAFWGGEVAMDQINPSPRIEKLRARHLSLKSRVGYECALYWTQAYKESEGEPRIIRRAKAIKKYMENVSLCIYPGELIVGGMERQPLTAIFYPDLKCDCFEPELDNFPTRKYDPCDIDEETKEIYRKEIFPYWKGKTLSEIWEKRAQSVAPESYKIGFEKCISEQQAITFFTLEHFVPGYQRMIDIGVLGIKKDIEEKLNNLDQAHPEYFEKAAFYQALLIVCNAFAKFGKRHAELARQLAATEADPQTKADYLKVAEVCERVPAEPARNFHEAVQALYLSHCLMLNDGASISFGRPDQYLYPYYKKDIEEGGITKAEAQDILDCLFIKCSEYQIFFSEGAAEFAAGARGANATCVGGVDENGKDATNELSYMFLQAMCNVRLAQPGISVLWHKNMPEELAIKACQLAALGTGHPSIYSTDRLIEMLQEMGLPLKAARRGTTVGCVEPSAEGGKSNTCSNFGYLNLAVGMEFALNQGVWRMSNERLGYPTDDPRTFTSFEQVMAAYRKQVAHLIRHHVILGQISEKLHEELDPDPYGDLFFEDCIENGKDIYAGGAKYNFGPGINCTGVADVVNSLAAIKYLIFDQKKLQWGELLDALANNFEGPKGEEILKMCQDAPKYGNDDPYADSIATEVLRFAPEEASKYTSQRGAPWRAAIIPLTTIIPFGMVTGALPGGRKAGVHLAEGCSPKQGTDVNGPTAAIKSITSFDHTAWLNGTQLNLKFSPAVLKDKWGLKNLISLVKTYMDRGGYHVQMNVVSKEILRDAQAHPEEYKSLTVRVSGYNAYFTVLSKELQDDIIDRTEHTMVV